MYERSAVILERYFSQKFYYREKNNLKNNFENYCMLIDILEKYQEVSNAEDKTIIECENIAEKIKQIQKKQTTLYRKAIKLYDDRKSVFENIDEPAHELQKQLKKIEHEIDKNNDISKPINKEFVETIEMFNEKSGIRYESGKKRRKIEKNYRTILENTISNLNEIDIDRISEVEKFISSDYDTIIEELKFVMLKNGEKEKIPFDINVIDKAIEFGLKLHIAEVQLLIEIYNKTNSIIEEVSENVVKIKKYKKLSKDTNNRIQFINVQKEYLIEFLDNERQSIGLGKKEHNKLMKEACNYFEKDTEQLNNLDNLLISEINGKVTNSMYENLYNIDYIQKLRKKEREFENKLSELNLVGKIVNPNYWRIGSLEKIYTAFNEIVSKQYGRDLDKYQSDNPEDEDFFNEEKQLITVSLNKQKEEPRIFNDDTEFDKSMDYYDNLETDYSITDDDYYEDDEISYEEDNEEGNYSEDEDVDVDVNKVDDSSSSDDQNEEIDTLIRKGKRKNSRIKKRKKKGLFGFKAN